MTVTLDGILWKPLPGATVTAEEFIAARSLLQEIHTLMQWSPWVMDDRAQEYGAALEASGQWTRADPGFEPKTAEELGAAMEQRLAEAEAQAIADQQSEKERTERAAHYDPERAQICLELLEARVCWEMRSANGMRSSAASCALWMTSTVRSIWRGSKQKSRPRPWWWTSSPRWWVTRRRPSLVWLPAARLSSRR